MEWRAAVYGVCECALMAMWCRRASRFCVIVLSGILGVACADSVPHKLDAPLSLTGMLIDGGVECPLFQADDGAQYTLLGDLHDLKSGDKVRLSGEEAAISFCMQGKTLSVRTISKINQGNPE